jgi:hypothetical protein
MGGRAGGGAAGGMGSRSRGGGFESSWQTKESSYIGKYSEYKSSKVEVSITNHGNEGPRVQAMELPSITPKGQSLKSEVKYFKTNKQAKAFANKFIKAAEGKPIIPKAKSMPKFKITKHGNLSGF